MKIGILGSADVARTPGSGFLKHGYEVIPGTRTSSGPADWQRQNVQARVGIEPFCILWRIPGFPRNDRIHAFRLLS